MKSFIKRVVPRPVWDGFRVVSGRAHLPEMGSVAGALYESLYEAHARSHPDDGAVGGGSFDLIGRILLSVLLQEGMQRTDTLVDLGCGTGRLAVHAIPILAGGHYIGIDISETMLERARERVARVVRDPPGKVTWIKQASSSFPLDSRSADFMIAASVFTHMEHEDCYRYLTDALRIVRPAGRFLFSCLPMELPAARQIFLQSAQDELQERWNKVRSVTTTREFMENIAELAGWKVLRWHPGDVPTIRLLDTDELCALGQSICVLERPSERAC
jgi:ubiquinone/menaquinone biosynthesis C-methylase UbiE